MNNKIRLFLLSAAIIFVTFSFQDCTVKKNKLKTNESADTTGLVIFHSNGLSFQIGEVIKEFNKIHPEIKVSLIAGNALENVKKMTEQNMKGDIFILIDNNQLDKLLIPNYTDWSIPFAGNEIVIAYNDKSKRSDAINTGNWYKILQEKGVKYGRADKELDPMGGKTILMLKLAQNNYQQKDLLKKLLTKDTQFIEPKSAGLLPLIDAGKVDYIITYKSMAVLHKLKYITLPDEINLKSLDHLADYSKVSIERKGKKEGQTRGVIGSPILYGMSVLRAAPHPQNAMLFAEFLLDPKKGLLIFEKSGNNIVSPIPCRHFDRIPEPLKKFVKPFENKGKMPEPKYMGSKAKPAK
jgi:molybdate/tungstate transport system substrate-binding protein